MTRDPFLEFIDAWDSASPNTGRPNLDELERTHAALDRLFGVDRFGEERRSEAVVFSEWMNRQRELRQEELELGEK